MTNLALKGIIAVQAMAEMSKAAGQSSDAKYYGVRHAELIVATCISYIRYQQYVSTNIEEWATLSVSSDKSHLLSSYGEESSSALMYNLFADLLLGVDIVPQAVCQSIYNISNCN